MYSAFSPVSGLKRTTSRFGAYWTGSKAVPVEYGPVRLTQRTDLDRCRVFPPKMLNGGGEQSFDRLFPMAAWLCQEVHDRPPLLVRPFRDQNGVAQDVALLFSQKNREVLRRATGISPVQEFLVSHNHEVVVRGGLFKEGRDSFVEGTNCGDRDRGVAPGRLCGL